jgi:hypothetical protein
MLSRNLTSKNELNTEELLSQDSGLVVNRISGVSYVQEAIIVLPFHKGGS